jgi:O-antigen/teichoic acid export membrane protein
MTFDTVSAASTDEEGPAPGPGAPARRGGKLYFFATIWAMAAALLRYVALARLLGPTELGLAATIVVTSAFFDQVSDTGSDRFLIQDAEGEAPRVQKLVQLVFLGRGIMIATLLVVLAGPIAAFYKAPQLAHGLMIFALSPLIMGLVHMDNRRRQRDHDFRTVAVMTIACETCSVIGTVVAAYLTHSFTAILYGLIARSIVMVAVSHLLAKRPYRIAYSKEVGPRLSKFARPLILNGVMLFIGSQSDRVIVGRKLGVSSLGHYSAVLLLVYYPSTVFLSFIHAIYVPLIAGHRGDVVERDKVIKTLGAQTMLLAVAMMLGFALVAPIAVTLLYGERYHEPAYILTLIGVLQIWRFLIVAPTTTAMSIGKSQTILIGNLMRLMVFPGAYIGLVLVGGLAGVVGGFAVGEAFAVIIETMLVNRDTGLRLTSGLDRLAIFLVACAAVVGMEVVWNNRSVSLATAAAVVLAISVTWLLIRERDSLKETVILARAWLRRMERRVRSRAPPLAGQ